MGNEKTEADGSEIAKEELGLIIKSIKGINGTEKNPFGWDMVHNEKEVQKRVDKFNDLLRDIQSKYCKKSQEFKGLTYGLKKEIYEVYKEASQKARNVMNKLISLKDLDAGTKQKEYEDKIEEAFKSTVTINFRTFSMSEKIKVSEDEEITLNEQIRRTGTIKSELLVPLMDIILTD